jgi:membrane fusion protein, multidrug efflux system
MAEVAFIARTEEPASRAGEDAAAEAEAALRRAGRTRQRRRVAAAAAGLLLLIAAAILVHQYQTVWVHRETTDNAYVRADIVPVAARIEAYVARVMVDDNQAVKAGDLLVVLEDADQAARLSRAEAELASARANLATLAAARGSAAAGAQGGAIGEAEARLQAVRANEARAAADEARLADLAGRGWATKARLDQVRAEAQALRAEIEAAEAALAARRGQAGALGANVTGAAAAIEAGRSQVEAAEAAVRVARIDMERTVLRAPADGVVGNRAVRPGQLVRPGQQLLSIVPVEAAYVIANFKETQLERMRVGQRATLRFDAYPSLKVRGRVDSLAPASGAQFALIPTDSATGNFTKIVQRVPVKIRIEPGDMPPGLMRPGLSVTATVHTGG